MRLVAIIAIFLFASPQGSQADSMRQNQVDRLLARLGSELREIRREPYAVDQPIHRPNVVRLAGTSRQALLEALGPPDICFEPSGVEGRCETAYQLCYFFFNTKPYYADGNLVVTAGGGWALIIDSQVGGAVSTAYWQAQK